MSILFSKGKDASDSFMSILDTHYIIFMGKIKTLMILLYLSSKLPWGKRDHISVITIDWENVKIDDSTITASISSGTWNDYCLD